jgi:thioredoxin 1
MYHFSTPAEVNDSTLSSIIKSHSFFVLDCWATWCGPCKFMAPIIDSLAKEYADKVFFGKLDVDKNSKTVKKYNIMSMPTFLIFKDGKIVDSIIGSVPKWKFKSAIEAHL